MPGRRKVEPPRGRLTLQQAAEISGLGYHRVYTLVTSGEVPGEQDASGTWTIARRDAAKIKRREPAGDKRKAVMLRPDLERYAAWARAAGDRPVSSWLASLADAASGYWRTRRAATVDRGEAPASARDPGWRRRQRS